MGDSDIIPVEESGEISVEKVTKDEFEVFQRGEGHVDFRTVGWLKAAIIFTKILFATGVLAIPSTMYVVGAVPGAILVVLFCVLNTYAGYILGNFRNAHGGCHSVADMAGIVGGPILKELCGGLFVLTWVICSASGIVGASTGLNALSNHSLCTNWFSFIVMLIVAIFASARKFETIGWLTWAGFLSIFVAIFIVVVSVSVISRPAAAPQSGPFDLGFHVVASPAFAPAITAVQTMFTSSAGTSAFLPVISEMRRPKDYNKALYLSMGIVVVTYLTFSIIIYYYCGKWVSSPSLGSAGPLIKKVAYGVGFIGLIVTACLWIHVSAKYVFVRVLRNSPHLQSNTFVHFGTWLSCTFGLSIVSFVIAAGVPIFNYILSLAGSIGFAPLALILPAYLWMYDHKDYRSGTLFKQTVYWLHCLMLFVGGFMTVGGFYGVIQSILDAYKNGEIGSAFSCEDNSTIK
ncbi:neutral amino acid permease [Penicillium atrosanguineum]|nr:neutral amino acid permease [Penicillium atrosanguineum]